MGRQAFLTRLALHLECTQMGRSAFEPLSPEASLEAIVGPPTDVREEKHSSSVDLPQDDSVIARSSNYQQKYDEKGYPENMTSKTLRKRWRHAVNDVLATLGVCVAKGQNAMPFSSTCDSSLILAVRLENNYGLYISATDTFSRFVSEHWSMALRQRLETFMTYSGIPLRNIVTGEWMRYGGLQFLLSGMLSSWTVIVLNVSMKWATRYAFKLLHGATEDIYTPNSWHERLKDVVLDYTEKLANLIVFILIVPFEINGTLQRLNIISISQWYPHPRAYIPMLSTEPIGERWRGYPNPIVLIPFIYIWFRRRNGIELTVSNHFWAALPKPSRPDRFSLLGAPVDSFDSSCIPGLHIQDYALDEWCANTVAGRLAYDLRIIKRNCQTFYDRCARALGWDYANTESSDLAEFSRRAQALLRNLRSELARGQSLPDVPEPSVTATNLGSQRQQAFRNPPEHSSPPLHPSPTVQSHHSTPSRPSRSHSSSPAPSLPASPRPIELSSQTDNGEVHVNLTIPAPPGMVRRTRMSEEPRQAGVSAALASTATLPEGTPWSTESTERERMVGQHTPTAGLHYRRGPHHRITALSAFPADSMAKRLSSLFMGILFIPFETLFVRSVAIAFLSSSSQLSRSEAATLGWKKEVYPLGAWFGPGLSVGGWKGVRDYMGKVLLVQGLGFGVGLVTWQLGMGIVWWVGRRWCAWRPGKSADFDGELRDLPGGTEMQ